MTIIGLTILLAVYVALALALVRFRVRRAVSISFGLTFATWLGWLMLAWSVPAVAQYTPPPGCGTPCKVTILKIKSGTTLTIQDAQGNAGPVFTDVGTTIDTALDGRLSASSITLPFVLSDLTNSNWTCSDNGTGVTCNQPASGTLNLGRADGTSQVNLGAYPAVFSLGNSLDSASLLLPQASGGFYFDEVTDGRVFYVYHNGTAALWQFDNSSGADFVGYTGDAATGMMFNAPAAGGTHEFRFGNVANSGFKIIDTGTDVASTRLANTGAMLWAADAKGASVNYIYGDASAIEYNVGSAKPHIFKVNDVETARVDAGGALLTGLKFTGESAAFVTRKYSAVIDVGSLAANACEIDTIDTADTADVTDDCEGNKPAELAALATTTTCYYSGSNIVLHVCNWSTITVDPASATYTCTCNED